MGITVTVIDSELIFADALAIRLEAEDDITVTAVAQAASGSLLDRPADVVLLDAALAAGAAHHLSTAQPGGRSQVVVLGPGGESALAGLDAGWAWIGKHDSVGHLLTVLREVAGGTGRPAAEAGGVPSRGQRGAAGTPVVLTPRERQVLDCLAEGAGRVEVAERLHLSANTARTHLQNLMRKLGVHSCVEAAAVARRGRGLAARPKAGAHHG